MFQPTFPTEPHTEAVTELAERPATPTVSWQPLPSDRTMTFCAAEDEQTDNTWLAEALWECYNN
ncbi:MAG: hypothetical protein HY784_00080 [Chloroflexi bacterium]|nr:hypothetical protein [Chloroflexota bacterium]